MEILKKFDGLTMQMFENGKEVFSGRYYRKSDFEYVPIYPTEIETKSDSIKSKKEKKRDCKCTYDCFIRFMPKLLMWMFIIILGAIFLGMIMTLVLDRWEAIEIIGYIILVCGYYSMILSPLLVIIIVLIVVCCPKCNCVKKRDN